MINVSSLFSFFPSFVGLICQQTHFVGLLDFFFICYFSEVTVDEAVIKGSQPLSLPFFTFKLCFLIFI